MEGNACQKWRQYSLAAAAPCAGPRGPIAAMMASHALRKPGDPAAADSPAVLPAACDRTAGLADRSAAAGPWASGGMQCWPRHGVLAAFIAGRLRRHRGRRRRRWSAALAAIAASLPDHGAGRLAVGRGRAGSSRDGRPLTSGRPACRRWPRGETFTTVGISQLTTSRQHLGRPVLVGRARTMKAGGSTGLCPWVTGADACDTIVTGAATADGGQCFFVVPTDAAGITIELAARDARAVRQPDLGGAVLGGPARACHRAAGAKRRPHRWPRDHRPWRSEQPGRDRDRAAARRRGGEPLAPIAAGLERGTRGPRCPARPRQPEAWACDPRADATTSLAADCQQPLVLRDPAAGGASRRPRKGGRLCRRRIPAGAARCASRLFVSPVLELLDRTRSRSRSDRAPATGGDWSPSRNRGTPWSVLDAARPGRSGRRAPTQNWHLTETRPCSR